MRYFFSSDDVEPDPEDTPTMAAFRALGLDPDREPEALKVPKQNSTYDMIVARAAHTSASWGLSRGTTLNKY